MDAFLHNTMIVSMDSSLRASLATTDTTKTADSASAHTVAVLPGNTNGGLGLPAAMVAVVQAGMYPALAIKAPDIFMLSFVRFLWRQPGRQGVEAAASLGCVAMPIHQPASLPPSSRQ